MIAPLAKLIDWCVLQAVPLGFSPRKCDKKQRRTRAKHSTPLHHPDTVRFHDDVREDRLDTVQGLGGDRLVHDDNFTGVRTGLAIPWVPRR
jgi:hypothetical protein